MVVHLLAHRWHGAPHMSRRTSRVLPTLFLAFLLGASIVAVQPAGGYPVTATQHGAANAAFPLGGVPAVDQWQAREETNRLYLHSDVTAPANNPIVTQEIPSARLDMVRPAVRLAPTQAGGEDLSEGPITQADAVANYQPADKMILVGPSERDPLLGEEIVNQGRNFYLSDAARQKDPVHVYAVGGSIYAACDVSSLNPSVFLTDDFEDSIGLELRVFLQQSNDGGQTWADVGGPIAEVVLVPSGGDPLTGIGPAAYEQIQPYRGSRAIATPEHGTGVALLPNVNRLRAEVSAEGAASCVVHYDTRTFGSYVSVRTDGARLATFTQDASGNPTTGFPQANRTDSLGRRFTVQVLQANPFGDSAGQLLDTSVQQPNLRLKDADGTDYLYYVEDLDEDGDDPIPLEFDIHEIELVSREDVAISPTAVRRTFVFSYPDDLENGPIQAEPYEDDQPWSLVGHVFRIGGRDISFRVAPGQERVHFINPGEPTEFAFEVANTGTEDDTITVSVAEPSGGWSARVVGGGQYFLRPGGRAIGVVEMIPPATAVSGTSQSVLVSASSSFSDVADPTPISFQARVTDEPGHGVRINTTTDLVQVRPGQLKSLALTVTNLGTARESFVVIPSVPSNVQGWTIVANPASQQIVAGGTAPVQLQLRAPGEAPTGQAFTLGLSVVAVGDATVTARKDLSVQVIAVEGVLVSLFEPALNRSMRLTADYCAGDPSGLCLGSEAGVGESFPDTDFDNTALFRVLVTNSGDREARFKVESFWDNNAVAGVVDARNCETPVPLGAPDGVPNGWRFNYAGGIGPIGAVGSGVNPSDANPPTSDVGRIDGFSGLYQLNTSTNPLVVPPHTTRPVYFELGWINGDPCPANPRPDGFDALSPAAAMTAVVSNLDDPAQRNRQTFVATVEDSGRFRGENDYAGAERLVGIEVAPGTPTEKATTLDSSAVFDVIATNLGNERDDLVIQVSGSAEWSHAVSVVRSVPPGNVCGTPAPSGGSIVVTCTGVGVFEEIHLQVVARPGEDVDVGDDDDVTVTVTSGDASPVIFRTLDLDVRAAGRFDMAFTVIGNATRTLAPGQTLAFPVLLRNRGTADDSYRLSLLRGGNTWKPTLSSGAPLFVPAGHDLPAFLVVTAPTTAAVGATDTFLLQAESLCNGEPACAGNKRTLEVSPIVQAATALRLAGRDGQDVLLPERGKATPVALQAVQTSGTPVSSIQFKVDTRSLPDGWTVDRNTVTVTPSPDASNSNLNTANATFQVKAPPGALGTARAILHVEATAAGGLKAGTDLTLNLASTFGLALNATDGTKQVIAPGGSALFNLTLENLGLGSDTVRMTSTAPPAGWTLRFNPASTGLGPLQEQRVEVKVTAPVSAKPADLASIVVFASSLGDPTQVASLPLVAQVGFHALRVELASPAVPAGAPQETVFHVFNVTNNGTLPDQVSITGVLDTVGQSRPVDLDLSVTRVALKPNETVQVRLDQAFSATAPSNSTAQSTVRFLSLLDARPEAQRAKAERSVTVRVLPYAFADVNDDGLRDYAVDRNQDGADGFEEFRPTRTAGGNPLASADVRRFLRDDVREAKSEDVTLPNGTLQRVVVLEIDGDRDGKIDHFLDRDGDDQPDFYWDPDANKASPIEFRKDINGDQVPESFVDTDGDGRLDAVYDLTRGTFTKVLQVDVDGDGQLDYVVDRNSNDLVDQDETVLYTRTGSLLIVQKVDVDGDGRIDQVFDTDGDGAPDYFIPAGSKGSVPLVMRDVSGDGVQDWTFDGDNDGRRESYYDPVTGEAHVIDAAGHFGDALREYWYVGALFIVVLALFVALVLVTRR